MEPASGWAAIAGAAIRMEITASGKSLRFIGSLLFITHVQLIKIIYL
jgi:hypothetical protein